MNLDRLLEQSQAGDHQALDTLVHETIDRLYAIACHVRRCRSR
jgi:hypothetical protein